MRRFAPLLLAFVAFVPPGAAAAPSKLHSIIAKAVADPARPADFRAADALRKPAETLAFSGVRPGMVVGEFYPGGGYFTRMISDVVGPKGHVYGLENPGWKGAVEANNKLLAEGKWKNVSMDAKPFGTVAFPKPLDLAWVTQNYHDLKIAEYGKVDTLAFDRAVYKALKPGGIFFILDHQGAAGPDRRTDWEDAPYQSRQGRSRGDVGRVQTGRRRQVPAPPGGRSHALDLRQGDPGPHRPICAEVRQAGALGAALPRSAALGRGRRRRRRWRRNYR